MAREASLPLGERRVVFNGSYQVDQLAGRMQRIDWVIVPSVWWEIFGLVISEAWMFGRPVIVSDVGGPAERVRDGVDGLKFPLASPRALADVMIRATSEPGLWEQLQTGITPPLERSVMVRRFAALYRQGATPAAGVEREGGAVDASAAVEASSAD
jgi:glycosyltransferase involved in cell wall biosynthesis